MINKGAIPMSNEPNQHEHHHEHKPKHTHPHDYDSVHEHADWHSHDHDAAHPHIHGGVNDYLAAVSAYRKTFASKQDVLDQTPDPAVREMLLHMEQLGCDTTFDRFDQQKPRVPSVWPVSAARSATWGPARSLRKARVVSAVPMPTSSSPATCCAVQPAV
jgi:carbon-monoxide dehydrogenase catalytic subunit